ncbi:S-formylglutathione hydrolase [Listeria booriae]|uniref:S-formylglutathione hydrolase n=1 Tax=Listeria booriae TaxID=1552123 RepID=A0A7X0TQN6_9LIST|nr:S-formylglutathione hydrolase [Listeria booriae]MBC1331674.1 S-formylglutathione hydrolase [Listeria booriae]MBC2387451.1 S-formylglutathione hydrolase [Listeria booriae]
MTEKLELLEEHRVFDGTQRKYQHHSETLHCTMTFSLFLPNVEKFSNPSLIWWLSGLTCTDDNFTHKAGAQKKAAELGLALVMPDTSPRGETVADDADWDLGQGAGFYVNATQQPWDANYQMYDYIVTELTTIVRETLGLTGSESIMGHSMGGHGALVIGLRNSDRFRAISVFSPIVNPSDVPWGMKAFDAYLGADKQAWASWDASKLLASHDGKSVPILLDQGTADNFLHVQLQPENLIAPEGYPLEIRMQDGYDHSYYFIASFIDEHLEFHQKHL